MKTDIVILTKCTDNLINKALTSIAKTTSPDVIGKLVIGYTGESLTEQEELVNLTRSLGFKNAVIEKMAYHFASCNNELVKRHCTSEAVLFMNDDVQLIDDCITECLEKLKYPEVGTVGVKLLYKDDTIQHAGICLKLVDGTTSLAGASHFGLRQKNQTIPILTTAGNTGAFLMMRRSTFIEVGMFDESFKVCFEDVVLNLKVIASGLTNVTLNNVSAYHYESQTRGKTCLQSDIIKMREAFEQCKNKSHLLERGLFAGWLIK